MAKYYKHAFELIKVVGEMDVTMELMLELDKLIKYIESPVFGGKLAISFYFQMRCYCTNYALVSLDEILVDHDEELCVVDGSVAVGVGLLDHGLDLVLAQRLAHVGHHVLQLPRADQPVPVFVEYLNEKKTTLLIKGFWFEIGVS